MREDLLKRVKRIEIATRRIMDDMMSGGYKSHFRGQGVQFSEHRTYTHGDDIRHIDWKVSARSKEPLLKQYEEERELNVFIIADFSGSIEFGSTLRTKRETLAEIGAMIAYAASNTGDKVGVLFVSDRVEKLTPLRKGRNHVLRIIRDLLTHPTHPGGTNLKAALDEARRLMKSRGVVFILSDFQCDSYERSLKRLSRKNDVVAVRISDPSESRILGGVSLEIFDPETGNLIELGSHPLQKDRAGVLSNEEFESNLKTLFTQSNVELIEINTKEDHAEKLLGFLKRRKKKR